LPGIGILGRIATAAFRAQRGAHFEVVLVGEIVSLYLIGWDVGSWKCTGESQDAIRILRCDGGSLVSVGQFEGNLLTQLNGHPPSLMVMLSAAGVRLPDDHKLIVAIDAVFGWPTQFLKLLAGDASYLPNCADRNTANRYLYRETERFLDGTFAMGSHPPMTAVGDAIGGAGAKAQWFLRHIRNAGNCFVPPLDPWTTGAAAGANLSLIEVYPSAAKFSSAFNEMTVPHGTKVSVLGKGDEADAMRAALIAACYAETIGLISNGYPHVYLPSGAHIAQLDQSAITTEGWIFTPTQ
jgi:hypothetical protein